MSKIKITKYQGCSNIDVANAVIDLSSNLIKMAGENTKLLEMIITLAITGWNISLFKAENNDYSKQVKKKLPKGFSDEYNEIFENFLINLIREKQEKYPDHIKGITSHKLKLDNGNIDLVVHALPIDPK